MSDLRETGSAKDPFTLDDVLQVGRIPPYDGVCDRLPPNGESFRKLQKPESHQKGEQEQAHYAGQPVA